MKHFVYTYKRESQDRNGNPRHWVSVWRIKNGKPLYLDRFSCGYRGIGPTVLNVIKAAKELPQKTRKTFRELEEQKIASISCLCEE